MRILRTNLALAGGILVGVVLVMALSRAQGASDAMFLLVMGRDIFGTNTPRDIYRANADGSDLTPLVAAPDRDEVSPQWSRDWQSIYYTDVTNLLSNIAAYSIRTGQRRNLSHTAGNAFPAPSPDNRRLLYISNVNGYNSLILLEDVAFEAEKPGNSRPLTTDESNQRYPNWRDEQTIIFNSLQGNPDGAATNLIEEMKIDGSQRRVLFENAVAPSVSDDGQWLVYVELPPTAPDNGRIMAYNLQSEAPPHHVYTITGNWQPPIAVSPNNEWVAISMEGDIYRVPLMGGKAERIIASPRYIYLQPTWSPLADEPLAWERLLLGGGGVMGVALLSILAAGFRRRRK